MITIKEITNKTLWEDFLSQQEINPYPFFQSWNWGEVQKNLGLSIQRLGFFDNNDKLLGVFLLVEVKARRGHYFHLRHGPVLKKFNDLYIDCLIQYIKTLGRTNDVSFLRMSPLIRKDTEVHRLFAKKGFRNAPIHNMDAEVCWVLDISKSEEELLKNMRKTHRYLIRKGIENKELRIVKTRDVKDVEKFLPLYQSLSVRKHFIPHRGVTEEFDMFGNKDQETLYLAEYQGKIIAGALIAFINNNAIYRHSASDDTYREIPAMHVILWEAIRDAKKREKNIFNFWGIAPTNSPNHPWQGLTLFKTGFGGEKQEYLHAQDLPLSLSYWKTYAIEFASKIIKGY